MPARSSRRLFSFTLPWCNPVDAFAAFHAQAYSLFFDTADAKQTRSRRSLILFEPEATLESFDQTIILARNGREEEHHGNPFDIVRKESANLPGIQGAPFAGLAAGLFGYELAGHLEVLPSPARSTLPDLALGFYTHGLVFNHTAQEAAYHIYAQTLEEATARHATLLANLAKPPTPSPSPSQQALRWRSNISRDDYQASIRAVIDAIFAGDIYQANLSQRFSATLSPGFDPFAHYRRLRAVNPAPYAAYLNFGGGRIVASASPELFLQVQDRLVTTKPIKGTARRLDNAAKDESVRRALVASEKDRAENIMIVDLLRNDLSRVCADDSLAVPELCAAQSFARVHHLVSTVTGTLRPDKTALDLLMACFPGGSITGAPKIRAMQIIADLECARRGPYCGALGWLNGAGDMTLNIAIRTLVYDGDTVSFNVGGGITTASDPDAEYQETLDKAAAIFESFGA